MLLYQLLPRLKFYFFPKEHIEKANAKNPYDNESILNQLLADMKNLEEKINQKVQFDSMWREMNQIVEKAEKKTISIARCYPMKNRVPDVLPFDNSRFDIFIFLKNFLLPTYIILQLAPYFCFQGGIANN